MLGVQMGEWFLREMNPVSQNQPRAGQWTIGIYKMYTVGVQVQNRKSFQARPWNHVAPVPVQSSFSSNATIRFQIVAEERHARNQNFRINKLPD